MHSTASGFVAANDTSPLFAFLGVACANGGGAQFVAILLGPFLLGA
jgi:hypothetical protein